MVPAHQHHPRADTIPPERRYQIAGLPVPTHATRHTGELDAEAILDELDRVEVPFEQEAWVDALARFVLFTSGDRS